MEVGMTSLLVPRAGGHWCWVGKEAIPVRRLAGKPAGDLEVEAGHVPQVVEVAATEVCCPLSVQKVYSAWDYAMARNTLITVY